MTGCPIPQAGWALLAQQFATVIDRRYNSTFQRNPADFRENAFFVRVNIFLLA